MNMVTAILGMNVLEYIKNMKKENGKCNSLFCNRQATYSVQSIYKREFKRSDLKSIPCCGKHKARSVKKLKKENYHCVFIQIIGMGYEGNHVEAA